MQLDWKWKKISDSLVHVTSHHISFHFYLFYYWFVFRSLSFASIFIRLCAIHLYSLLAIYSNVIIKQAITAILLSPYVVDSSGNALPSSFFSFIYFMHDQLNVVAWNALCLSLAKLQRHLNSCVYKRASGCWNIFCFFCWYAIALLILDIVIKHHRGENAHVSDTWSIRFANSMKLCWFLWFGKKYWFSHDFFLKMIFNSIFVIFPTDFIKYI